MRFDRPPVSIRLAAKIKNGIDISENLSSPPNMRCASTIGSSPVKSSIEARTATASATKIGTLPNSSASSAHIRKTVI